MILMYSERLDAAVALVAQISNLLYRGFPTFLRHKSPDLLQLASLVFVVSNYGFQPFSFVSDFGFRAAIHGTSSLITSFLPCRNES